MTSAGSVGGRGVKDGMSCEGLLHLHDALGQVGWDLRQAFTAAVHDVVVAGAAGRTHRHLGGTGPGLRLNWTWRHTITSRHASKSQWTRQSTRACHRSQIAWLPLWDLLTPGDAWISSFLIDLLTNVHV